MERHRLPIPSPEQALREATRARKGSEGLPKTIASDLPRTLSKHTRVLWDHYWQNVGKDFSGLRQKNQLVRVWEQFCQFMPEARTFSEPNDIVHRLDTEGPPDNIGNAFIAWRREQTQDCQKTLDRLLPVWKKRAEQAILLGIEQDAFSGLNTERVHQVIASVAVLWGDPLARGNHDGGRSLVETNSIHLYTDGTEELKQGDGYHMFLHELFHALSGSRAFTVTEKSDLLGWSQKKTEHTKVGARLSSERVPMFLSWMNEGLTEEHTQITLKLSGLSAGVAHAEHVQLLDQFRSALSLPPELLQSFYFESYRVTPEQTWLNNIKTALGLQKAPSKESVHRLPATRDFFREISEKTYPLFLFHLDALVNKTGSAFVCEQWKKHGASFPLWLEDVQTGRIPNNGIPNTEPVLDRVTVQEPKPSTES